MKIIKLSLAAFLACGATTVFAANDIASAFKEGKLEGRLRAHYMGADYEDNSAASGVGKVDSKGLAVGGSLIYSTAPLAGVSATVGAYTTQNPFGITEDKSTSSNYVSNKDLFWDAPTNNPYHYAKGYAVLAQAYLQYQVSKTQLKAGRMLLTNPFMTPNDTKMIPTAFQAIAAESKDVANTTINAAYISHYKERRRESFSSVVDSADAPDALKGYYHVENGTGGNDAAGLVVVGAKNSSIKGVTLEAWYLNWSDIVDQTVLEANYNTKIGDFGINLGARLFNQFDRGAGDIIKPKSGAKYGSSAYKFKGDNDDKIGTYMYALRTVGSLGAAKLLLSYSHTDKGGDLLAPWRAFPTDGYTRSMTQTDWNANTTAYKTQLDYDFSSLVKGVSALLAYSYYNRDESKVPYQAMTHRGYTNGDTIQWNFDVTYKPAFSKNTEFKVRTMDQRNDTVGKVATNSSTANKDTSVKELRIEANYRF